MLPSTILVLYKQKDLESIKDAVQKFNGVLIARGIDPKLKLISDIKKGETTH